MHPEHYAREVLTSNIEAVVAEVRRLKDVGRYISVPRKQVKSGTHRLQDVEVATTEGDIIDSAYRKMRAVELMAALSDDTSDSSSDSTTSPESDSSSEDAE